MFPMLPLSVTCRLIPRLTNHPQPLLPAPPLLSVFTNAAAPLLLPVLTLPTPPSIVVAAFAAVDLSDHPVSAKTSVRLY